MRLETDFTENEEKKGSRTALYSAVFIMSIAVFVVLMIALTSTPPKNDKKNNDNIIPVENNSDIGQESGNSVIDNSAIEPVKGTETVDLSGKNEQKERKLEGNTSNIPVKIQVAVKEEIKIEEKKIEDKKDEPDLVLVFEKALDSENINEIKNVILSYNGDNSYLLSVKKHTEIYMGALKAIKEGRFNDVMDYLYRINGDKEKTVVYKYAATKIEFINKYEDTAETLYNKYLLLKDRGNHIEAEKVSGEIKAKYPYSRAAENLK